jgi:hypothetical protein
MAGCWLLAFVSGVRRVAVVRVLAFVAERGYEVSMKAEQPGAREAAFASGMMVESHAPPA